MHKSLVVTALYLSFCFPLFSQSVQLSQVNGEHNFVTLRNNEVVDIGKYVRVLKAEWGSKPRNEDMGRTDNGLTTIRIIGDEGSTIQSPILFDSQKWLMGLTFDWSYPRRYRVEVRLVSFPNIKSLALTQGAVLDLLSDNPIRLQKFGFDIDPKASGEACFKAFATPRALYDHNEYVGCRNLNVCH